MTADVDDPSVYLLDLSRATPNAAISDRLTQDCWTVVDYEIEASAGPCSSRRAHRIRPPSSSIHR